MELRPHVSLKRWLFGHGQVFVCLGMVWFAVIVVGFWVTTVLVTVEDWSRADVLLLGVTMGDSARLAWSERAPNSLAITLVRSGSIVLMGDGRVR